MAKDVSKPTQNYFDLGDSDANTKEVKVYTSDDLKVALTFIESYYQTQGGKLPAFEEFDWLKGLGYGKTRTLKLLQSEDLRIGLSRRGIAWPKNYDPARTDIVRTLTPQQQHAILIVTDPTRNDSLRKRLELVGISYQTWRNWMKQSKFNQAVVTLSEDMLTDNTASVHTSLAQKAMTGDVGAARLFYELTGRHDPAKQQMVDLARIIALVLESLTRHVTDATILRKVEDDLGLIVAGKTPQIEGPQADLSFVQGLIEDAVEVPDDAAQNPAQVNSAGTPESDVPERTEVAEVGRDADNVPKGFFDL